MRINTSKSEAMVLSQKRVEYPPRAGSETLLYFAATSCILLPSASKSDANPIDPPDPVSSGVV